MILEQSYKFKNFQDLLVEIGLTAEFRQAGMIKASHLEVGWGWGVL